MVDKRKSTSLKAQRGGRYLELNRSCLIAKRKPSCALPSPSTSTAAPYKGVRMRVWGKWVTEVRDPVTKTRIWLGSFATAEMAARAYDAAMVCLKGPCAPEVNFPDSIPSFVVPQCNSSRKEIQAVAMAAATASVPVAAPLAMAAEPDREFQAHASESVDIDLVGSTFEPGNSAECSSSNVENWINQEFQDLDALDDLPEIPLSHQFWDLAEQALPSLPMLEDSDDCSSLHRDMQLWSFV